MTYLPGEEEQEGGRVLRFAVPILVLIAIIAAVWWYATQEAGVKRQLEHVTTMLPTQLPPPPPPPPKPIEPPKPIQQVIQQPVNAPPPPTPTPQSNNQVTINAPAQDTGPGDFAIAAGNGTGMTGTGGVGFAMNAGQYGQYARGRILAAVKGSDLLKDKEFVAVVRLWFNGQGAITKVEIAKPTGTETFDGELQKILGTLSGFNPPPANVIAQMPIQFTIDERRS